MKFRGKQIFLPVERCSALAWGGGLGAAAGCGFIPWWTLLFLLPGIFLLDRPCRIFFGFALSLSLASGLYCSFERAESLAGYSGAEQCCGVFIVRDSRMTGVDGIVPEFNVRGEFRSGENPAAIEVLAAFAPELKRGGMIYGDRFKVEAVLQLPAPAGFYFDGKKISGVIPPPYGHSTLLQIGKFEKLPPENSLLRGCFLLREFLLERLVSGFEDAECRSMAARLFLGGSEGGSRSSRRNFMLAGIIHIFAVSGMHVGILAMIAGVMLSAVPFRQRHLLLAGIVILYVIGSGLAIPALRAGAMIVAWCLLRAFLYYTPNWNILTLTFFVLCVVTPEAVGDLGTQYSFGITAALMLGIPVLQELFSRIGIPERFMHHSNRVARSFNRKQILYRRIIFPIGAAMIAFSASSMLTTLHNKIFIPGSIVTNLSIIFVTPFMFAVFVFKMIFGGVSGFIDRSCAWLIESGFELLRNVSQLFLEIFPPVAVPEPPVWVVALFYLLFFVALAVRKFLWRVIFAGAALALLLLFPLFAGIAPEQIAIFSGSSEHPPTLIYLKPADSRALVCDLSDRWSALLAADEIRRQGCGEVEIFFSGNRSANNAGLAAFASRLIPQSLHPAPGRQTVYFKKNMVLPESDDSRSIFNFSDPRIPEVTTESKAWLWRPEEGVSISVRQSDEGWHFYGKMRDGRTFSVTLPWSNQVLMWQLTSKSNR